MQLPPNNLRWGFSVSDPLDSFVALVVGHHGINDKAKLSEIAAGTFGLVRDRSVYYCSAFAVRFSRSASRSFGNTVLSLSKLQKYDDRPFIVCLVTPTRNYCLIANSTFLKKISHSSEELRENNIRGSFNGSDIVREFEGIQNCAGNIRKLFAIHAEVGFDGNLTRLVEATNNISPSGAKFQVSGETEAVILAAPSRAIEFVDGPDSHVLKAELDAKVQRFKKEILLAALIENVNIRGRVIEYIIAGEDETLRQELVRALKSRYSIPEFRTGNALGDYKRVFDTTDTETDVKTKIMVLNSNPKAYNIDKVLEFLSRERSVFMFYFVGIDPGRIANTVLVSMFQRDLLRSTILLRHWAGRNSRGVTQFEGRTIDSLISYPDTVIGESEAVAFLKRLVAL